MFLGTPSARRYYNNVKPDTEQIEKAVGNKKRIHQITLIAILVSCATGLQMLESPLPRILPWLKIGLANVITLYAIIRINSLTGIFVAALRTCLAAFILGSFFSPIHIISFSGAVMAAIVMAIIVHFLPKSSVCIVSIFGAIASNISQLLAVQIIFASNLSFWLHIAMIIWVGVPAGLIVGKITYELLRRT